MIFTAFLTALAVLAVCLAWQFAAAARREYRKWTNRGVHAMPRPKGPRPLFDPQPAPLPPTLEAPMARVRDWLPRITAGRRAASDDSERIAS